MAAYVYHEIACDHGWPVKALCGDGMDGCCYAAYTDRGTATRVRASARRAGWATGPGGKDLCPDHRGPK